MKKIFKALILGSIIGAFVLAPAVKPAQAATVEELQALIAQLQAQIAALTAAQSGETATSSGTIASGVLSFRKLNSSISLEKSSEMTGLAAMVKVKISNKGTKSIYLPYDSSPKFGLIFTLSHSLGKQSPTRCTFAHSAAIDPDRDLLAEDISRSRLYELKANSSIDVQINTSCDTNQMFAGIYRGEVESFTYYTYPDTSDSTHYRNIAITDLKTSPYYIVGEQGPWIEKTNYVSGKDAATITGERLYNGKIYFDGQLISAAKVTYNTNSQLSFIPPTYTGYHLIYVEKTTGKSNTKAIDFDFNVRYSVYDINQDNQVNQTDVNLVQDCMLDRSTCTDTYRARADVNNSGKIDAADLQLVTNEAGVLTSSGVGNVEARLSGVSTAARTMTTDRVRVTEGVVLGTIDLRISGRSGTINELKLRLKDGEGDLPLSRIIERLYLCDGASTPCYGVDSISWLSTFSNMNIGLVKDQWKTLAIKADIQSLPIGSVGKITIGLDANSSNIVGIDDGYNRFTVTSNTIESAPITFIDTSGDLLTLNVPSSAVAGSNVAINWNAKVNPASSICKLKYYDEGIKAYKDEMVTCNEPGSRQLTYNAPGDYKVYLYVQNRLTAVHEKLYEVQKTISVSARSASASIQVPTTAVSGQNFTVSWSATNLQSVNSICKLYYYVRNSAYTEETVSCSGSRQFTYSSLKPFNFAIRVYNQVSNALEAEAKGVVTIHAAPTSANTLNQMASVLNSISAMLKQLTN